jgi:hypothetical protein
MEMISDGASLPVGAHPPMKLKEFLQATAFHE